MQRFQIDFSAIILDEIALEGLYGITIEALCKRLSNNPNWPLKPVDDSIKRIIWSFIGRLKNIEFFRLENPRDPLIIYNRFDYIHSEFGSLYEPTNIPPDIYPNHPVEDGPIMGSCKEYFTRFNLGSFPRKISIEEAEKRFDRCLVIVANQETRTKVLIPADKQCTLKISVRYYLVLERIGRSRYLGEASFGTHSLRTIFHDSKALSYIRSRLTDDGLIKNQTLSCYGNNSQVANRIVISSLVRFFVKQQSMIDVMVARIVEFLKVQPKLLASYEQIKTECNISSAKTFKQPQLKKVCDTNLMVKYRELFPNATKNEYLYKKDQKFERVIRCVRLKHNENEENSDEEQEKKTTVEGREIKLDSTFERQILRWIERHGDSGVTLSDISRAFRFTTDGSLERILKKLTHLKYLTKSYCDRGRSKVFSYIANNYNSVFEDDENKIKINSSIVNDSLMETTVDNINISTEKINEHTQIKIECELKQNEVTSNNIEPDNEYTEEYNENEISINLPVQNENSKQCEIEQTITRIMEYGYCRSVYESYKQSVSLTDRFYFRQRIIFSMLSSENIISLLSIKKNIIETEKDYPKFIGTLDIKTLVKIIGYSEKMEKLKSVQYRVTHETKTVNHTFVGISSVDFNSAESISYMNSFLNRFNNTMKTSRANKKWNLMIHRSPEPKINISELKLPRFMKMRTLHEYLYYIVYDHPGESLRNACNEIDATVESYRSDIIKGDMAELPKVYFPTIGWKMFVPPLQKSPKYPNGWFFVSDIIHHMPLDIMLKIVNFNKSKVNLDKLINYATHPVYKYLPLMTLSSDVRCILSQGQKKHIQNTLNVLRLLCTIGLIQFSEKTYKDTELIYAYLNKRASLLNTVKSNPGYYRVSDMDYEQRTYEFFSSYELETFWLDTWYFCTNTPLGYKITDGINKPKRREIIERSKIAIEQACASRSILEAGAQDDGTIPGDNKGAAGFDSHLFAHLARNWSIKKKISTMPSTMPSTRRRTKLNILLMQRMTNRKINEKKKNESSNQLYKMRFKWTPAEDQILLFWKLGTMIIKQVKSHAFLSYGIKDVVRSIFGKYYRSKSIDNYLRRIRYLMQYSSIETSVNLLYEDLKADKEINYTFRVDIEKQHELYNAKKFKIMRDLIVLNIKQLIEILRERGTTINTECVKSRKKKLPMAKPTDEKKQVDLSDTQGHTDFLDVQYNYSDTISHQEDLVREVDYLFTVEEISISVINALIHSSLNNQTTDPRTSLIYLHAFKPYPEKILQLTFSTIKENNLITCSQYHKQSLQILLSTPHIIQSKTYVYSTKFFTTLVGNTDIGHYKDAFITYSYIKDDLSKHKMLLLHPSRGLCSVLTSLSIMNIVDLSIEFDKKYLEYMPNENLEEGSKCLKNTLKRMRSRHFDLLSTTNDSVEYIKIITSVTKQLKNYQVICKLKQSVLDFEKEIDLVLKRIFSQPTFEPKLTSSKNLSDLCIQVLEFCYSKGIFGASQRDIKEHFVGLSLGLLARSLRNLIDRDLVLRAGIEVPSFVHHKHADLWLVKIPSTYFSGINCDVVNKDDNNILLTEFISEDLDPMEPPLKKICKDHPKEHVNNDTLIYIKVRPWTRMDLTINKELLHKFMNSILSKIIIKPGIYLKTLKKEYYPILQPMFIRELVEMLEALKCIKMIHFQHTISRPSFFSDPSPSNHSLLFSNMKGLEDESLIMLEPTLDCEIRFGYFSNKIGYDII